MTVVISKLNLLTSKKKNGNDEKHECFFHGGHCFISPSLLPSKTQPIQLVIWVQTKNEFYERMKGLMVLSIVFY